MGQRLNLQLLLEQVLGSRNVYFQPPEDTKINYPCIKYSLDDVDITHANNTPYNHTKGYMVMLIDGDPDSIILDKLIALPKCTYQRHYKADNLNHTVFILYY